MSCHGESIRLQGNSFTKKANGFNWKHKRSLANWACSKMGLLGMPIEEIAATRIQTAFRAFMARKALRRMRGVVRFQTLMEGITVRKQALNTLNYVHSWSKIQAQIRNRRHHMVTEGRIKQKKLENQLKLEAKLHELEVEWCGGSETMEEILSRVQQREEAAVKRERAMAYAFSHQWRANSSQYLGQTYYELGKESWGWSWKERWIAARPWETRVPSQHIIPKKVRAKQGKEVARFKSQLPKMSVSGRPTSSNGNGIATNKKLSPTPDKLPVEGLDPKAITSSTAMIEVEKTEEELHAA
ncbi:hypothetical protein RJ641_034350 [Dillenia turbinata]|uniref:Protein IQ-DOMAIN 1 n=1 Tax=Dillenia turbinata TaxID=194707 RepID=A0AAN8VHA0_9MAGN